MNLTTRILNAIAQMSGGVEAGQADDYTGGDTPEDWKQRQAAVDAGSWARQELDKRHGKGWRK